MKKTFLMLILAFSTLLSANAKDGQIIKTGYNLGPLPVVAFDADKGFQYGAILQLFNYGDGTNYPNYDSKTYFELSHFSKGSTLIQLMYDNKELLPGIRLSCASTVNIDKAMDFLGFNGYGTYYDYQAIADGKAGNSFLYSPFYKFSKTSFMVKADLVGKISRGLYWEAGYHAYYAKIGDIDYDNVNKGKDPSQVFPLEIATLFKSYCDQGIIDPKDADGGFVSSIRAGLCYDTRDKEGAPTRGIWAEGHIMAAPGFLGTENPFCRYSFTFRHYLPIVKNDILTFAYRLNYEGTIGNNAPFYILPYITVMGENGDKDGMGGYRTVRGIIRDRVVGLDMASYCAEFRWRFMSFTLGRQNIALGLSAFSDGTMVTKEIPFAANLNPAPGADHDTPHITFGAGFRFIMNENFIVAAEYGTPLTHFMKNSPLYNQDGTGAFYVNVGYLF